MLSLKWNKISFPKDLASLLHSSACCFSPTNTMMPESNTTSDEEDVEIEACDKDEPTNSVYAQDDETFEMEYSEFQKRLEEESIESSGSFSAKAMTNCVILVVTGIGAMLVPGMLAVFGVRLCESRRCGLLDTVSNSTVDEEGSNNKLYTLSNLPDFTIQALRDPLSAQSHAMAWILQEEAFESYSESQKLQRFSLATLYFSTHGADWRSNEDWLSEKHECEWFAQSYYQDDSSTTICPDMNTGQYHVLSLSDNALQGTLPPEIMLLTNLVTLDLQSNTLSGSIPTELGNNNNQNLQILSLSRNRLKGAIPSELGQISSLTELLLYDNELEESIPSQLGRLVELKELWLNGNLLSGTIPSQLGQLDGLEWCWLSQNELDGTLPTELGNLAHLTGLSVSQNALYGSIPSQIGGLTMLQELSLDMNELSGSIPHQVGLMTSLNHVFLQQNALTGPIPSEISLCASLQKIDLGRNELVDIIPYEIGFMPDLKVLILQHNNLEGLVPMSLVMNSQLNELNLVGNFFEGTMPGDLCEVQYLRFDCSDSLCGCDTCACES